MFSPQLTSYDYDAPISEAGGAGQPGIGGPNKFQVGPLALPIVRTRGGNLSGSSSHRVQALDFRVMV